MASHGVESWHTDPDFYYQRGGGPMLDMGPYYLTAMINLLGGIKEVYAYTNTAHATRLITAEPHVGEIIQVNTPTHYEAFVTLESGLRVSLLTSFDIYKSKQPKIEIYGTKGTLLEWIELPLEFDYAENSRCLGLDDLAKALESGRRGRTTSRQTFHVLEAMCGIMKSAETGKPYTMTSRFEREAPMDPTLPHGVL